MSLKSILTILALVCLPGHTLASGYPECGTSMACFESNSNCVTNGGCAMLAAYNYDANKQQVNFMIQGNGISSGYYVALGISTDSYMGSDMVFVCANGNPPSILTTWNPGYSNVAASNVMLQNQNCASANSVLTCNFTVADSISPIANGQTHVLNFATTKFYFLLATGRLNGASLYKYNTYAISSSSMDMKFTPISTTTKNAVTITQTVTTTDTVTTNDDVTTTVEERTTSENNSTENSSNGENIGKTLAQGNGSESTAIYNFSQKTTGLKSDAGGIEMTMTIGISWIILILLF